MRTFQSLDAIRETIQARHEIARVYTWYRGLETYLKPEEDALAALKLQRQYDRLEKTKNIKFDEEAFLGLNGGSD